MSVKLKGISLVVIATLFWGMMGICSRNLSLAGFSSFDISFFRCLIAGALFLLWMLFKDKKVLMLDKKGILTCGLYGIGTFAISFISYNIAVERIPISVATVLMFTNPIWVTIFNAIFFKEKINAKKILVIILCIIGCLCIADIFTSGNIELDPIGVIAGIVNGMAFAMQIIIPRFFVGKYEQDSMLIYGFLGGALFLALFTDFNNIFTILSTDTSIMSSIGNILFISVLSTFIANTFYVKSTTYIGTSLTSILVSLEPILGSLFAFIIFKEVMSSIQILGAGIVIIAAVILELDIPKIKYMVLSYLSKNDSIDKYSEGKKKENL